MEWVWLAIGGISVALCMKLVAAQYARQDRRRRMGLPRVESNWSNRSRPGDDWRTFAPKWSSPIRQVTPDWAVIVDDDREHCPECGRFAATPGGLCARCEMDRLGEDR